LDPDPASYHPPPSVFFPADFLPGTALIVAGIIALLILLMLSAWFSGSEAALASLGASKRAPLTRTRRQSRLLENPRALLITLLILNTVINVSAACIAAFLAAVAAQAAGIASTPMLILGMAVFTTVLLVMGELTPRIVAPRLAPAFVGTGSGPLLAIHRVMAPFSTWLARSTELFRRRSVSDDARISNEELKAMVDAGEAQGTIEEQERELIYSIVEFGETTAREVMISRVDMVALPMSATMQIAVETIRTSGHSRLPLFVEHIDNVVGIVHAKDLLPYLGNGQQNDTINWAEIARPPLFVPLGKKLDDLLREFQSTKTHIAIVVDEYGGTAGLVTLEDILEEIVGDIRDEHDDGEPPLFERLDDDAIRVDARINLDDLEEILELRFDPDDFDFETVGGLIFHLTGAIPVEGEEVVYENLSLYVENVSNHRIGTVIIRDAATAVDESDNSDGQEKQD